jgi:hypothetical protein
MNPNGIPSISPGLRGTRYPGLADPKKFNPNGVASPFARKLFNPFRVDVIRGMVFRRSRFAPTPG